MLELNLAQHISYKITFLTKNTFIKGDTVVANIIAS